jgi:hypothetical protein
MERSLPEHLALLRTYDNREDRVEYTAILKQVLHKFGKTHPFPAIYYFLSLSNHPLSVLL